MVVASCRTSTSKTPRRRPLLAVEQGPPGIYNIVDDEPAPVREWLPVLASALDAKPPRRIPRWLGRLAAGEAATVMMTEARGASNAKAKRELGWQPQLSRAGGRASRRDSAEAMTEKELDALRPLAFAIAYRMLDRVRRMWCRRGSCACTGREGGGRIESPRLPVDDGFRGSCSTSSGGPGSGEWLPEPLVASVDDDPAARPRWRTRRRSPSCSRTSGAPSTIALATNEDNP